MGREVDPDLVASHYAQTPVSLLGHGVGAAALLMLFWGHGELRVQLQAWLTLFALVWVGRAALAWRYARARPIASCQWHAWQRRLTLVTLAGGAVWALAATLFYGAADMLQRIALVMILYGYCAGLSSTSYRVFLVYTGMTFIPLIAWEASEGLSHSLPLAGVFTLAWVTTAVIGRHHRTAFLQVLALKRRTQRLAEHLRQEKAAAEAARSRAEAATRAKTQFFQAASHDLRQPLHALGLFAGALQHQPHDEASARLVHSIAESVDALEGLFTELLDLTRIDSGGIDVRPQSVSLQEVFGRLQLDFEPLAFDKGLALHFVGGRHWVHVDPVVLERILRNLLANAIRYTEDGGVLLSCRPRAGQLLLQVWDTGIGIRAEALPYIFDEFYQVSGARRLQSHHRKGLGLGLAIVKRLTDLVQVPLQVRSVPEQGSVFSLTLPMGVPMQLGTQPAPAPAASSLTLAGRHIVVVEDDTVVMQALQALLESWGARVRGFMSYAEAVQWAGLPAVAAPDLLIVDHGLPEGRTGQEVLAVLRERFGPSLPTVMVTGDKLLNLEREVAALDCHLLYKPVAPNRLRALVAYKLSGPGGG